MLLHLNAHLLELRPSCILQRSTTPPGKQVGGKQVVTTGRALGIHFGCRSHALSTSQEHVHNSNCWTKSDQEFGGTRDAKNLDCHFKSEAGKLNCAGSHKGVLIRTDPKNSWCRRWGSGAWGFLILHRGRDYKQIQLISFNLRVPPTFCMWQNPLNVYNI